MSIVVTKQTGLTILDAYGTKINVRNGTHTFTEPTTDLITVKDEETGQVVIAGISIDKFVDTGNSAVATTLANLITYITPDEPKDIVDLLEQQTGESQLDATKLKNFSAAATAAGLGGFESVNFLSRTTNADDQIITKDGHYLYDSSRFTAQGVVGDSTSIRLPLNGTVNTVLLETSSNRVKQGINVYANSNANTLSQKISNSQKFLATFNSGDSTWSFEQIPDNNPNYVGTMEVFNLASQFGTKAYNFDTSHIHLTGGFDGGKIFSYSQPKKLTISADRSINSNGKHFFLRWYDFTGGGVADLRFDDLPYPVEIYFPTQSKTTTLQVYCPRTGKRQTLTQHTDATVDQSIFSENSTRSLFEGQITAPAVTGGLQMAIAKVIDVPQTLGVNEYLTFDIIMDLTGVGYAGDNWQFQAGFVHEDDWTGFEEGTTLDFNTRSADLLSFLSFDGNGALPSRKVRYAGANGNLASQSGTFAQRSVIGIAFDNTSGMLSTGTLTNNFKAGNYKVVVYQVSEAQVHPEQVLGTIESLNVEVLSAFDDDFVLKLAKVGVDLNIIE